MASLFASSVASNGDDGARKLAYESMRAKWPAIADALFGTTSGGPTPISTPPFSIVLFTEGAWLKYCLRSDDYPLNCFGSVEAALDGLDGLEKSLQEGQFSWRPRKDRKRS
jgi:hypothetical protein